MLFFNNEISIIQIAIRFTSLMGKLTEKPFLLINRRDFLDFHDYSNVIRDQMSRFSIKPIHSGRFHGKTGSNLPESYKEMKDDAVNFINVCTSGDD